MAAITMISITLLMRTMKINALTLDGLEIPRDRLVIKIGIFSLAIVI